MNKIEMAIEAFEQYEIYATPFLKRTKAQKQRLETAWKLRRSMPSLIMRMYLIYQKYKIGYLAMNGGEAFIVREVAYVFGNNVVIEYEKFPKVKKVVNCGTERYPLSVQDYKLNFLTA